MKVFWRLPELCFSRRHSQSCFTNLNGIGTLFSASADLCCFRDTSVYFDNLCARSCGIWSHFIASVMVFWIPLVSTTSTAIFFSVENRYLTVGSHDANRKRAPKIPGDEDEVVRTTTLPRFEFDWIANLFTASCKYFKWSPFPPVAWLILPLIYQVIGKSLLEFSILLMTFKESVKTTGEMCSNMRTECCRLGSRGTDLWQPIKCWVKPWENR